MAVKPPIAPDIATRWFKAVSKALLRRAADTTYPALQGDNTYCMPGTWLQLYRA